MLSKANIKDQQSCHEHTSLSESSITHTSEIRTVKARADFEQSALAVNVQKRSICSNAAERILAVCLLRCDPGYHLCILWRMRETEDKTRNAKGKCLVVGTSGGCLYQHSDGPSTRRHASKVPVNRMSGVEEASCFNSCPTWTSNCGFRNMSTSMTSKMLGRLPRTSPNPSNTFNALLFMSPLQAQMGKSVGITVNNTSNGSKQEALGKPLSNPRT